MTQIFSQTGNAFPVTLIKTGPCVITNFKNDSLKKHNVIQLGFLEVEDKKLNKPMLGYFKKYSLPSLKYLQEFKVSSDEIYSIGMELKIDKFYEGQSVKVSGYSIGKGFSGNQKRHNFKRGPMSHGSKNHRQPGSIGAGSTPGRVFPGTRMAGRLGNKYISIPNLKIIKIDICNHLLFVKGAVPGKVGNILSIVT